MSIHIHREPLEETSRQKYGADRWCFRCRKKTRFDLVVLAPPARILSYYGPAAHIECTVCRTQDADCFPGTYREWSDPE